MISFSQFRPKHLIWLCLASFLGTYCNYTLKIKDGTTAVQRKQYDEAIPMLEKEISKSKSKVQKGKLAYMLGESWRLQGNDEKASKWYQMAYDNAYGPEALRAYAFGLKKLGLYEEAKAKFKDTGIEIGSPYEYRKEITACVVSQAWLKEMDKNEWQITLAPFNSPQNDFSPVFYEDNHLLLTSDRVMSTAKAAYKWTGNPYFDILMVTEEGASPQVYDASLHSEYNDAMPTFTKDYSEMCFVRSTGALKYDDKYNKIYFSERKEKYWSNPQALPFQKEKVNYVAPSFSADGKVLYFAANDSEGWGGYDIYYVERKEDLENPWGEPKLLSRNINTLGNESFPTVHGDTLYFASDGLPGMGGFDIFKTWRVDNAWAPPQNLKAPLNSSYDDFGIIYKQKVAGSKVGDLLSEGYFTSNRQEGGKGGDDIYRFVQKVPPPKPIPVDTTPPVVAQTHKIMLNVITLEKILSNPADPNSTVYGRKPLLGAKLTIAAKGKTTTVDVNGEGTHTLELEPQTDYAFTASAPDFLANTGKFSSKGIAKDPKNPVQTFDLEIVLDKIFRNKEIVLENIYYDYDKSDIRPDAEPTLNALATVLEQNPSIKIVLGSHTDCRGNDSYNQQLSQRRAQAAVDYLIGKGIATERLSAVGYGESSPAVSCLCNRCSESEHQANRRTTFLISDK